MGILAIEDGAVTSVMVPDVVTVDGDARVARVYLIRNPDKLARLSADLRDGRVRDVIPA